MNYDKIKTYVATVADGNSVAETVPAPADGVSIPKGYDVVALGIVQATNGGSDNYKVGLKNEQESYIMEPAHKTLFVASENAEPGKRANNINLDGGRTYLPVVSNTVQPSGSDRVVHFVFYLKKSE